MLSPCKGLQFNKCFDKTLWCSLHCTIFFLRLFMFSPGTDHHGFRTSHGDGWLLTVAVLEGINLPLVADTLDPYVMLNCNGITKTSSVQLQTQDPQWNG